VKGANVQYHANVEPELGQYDPDPVQFVYAAATDQHGSDVVLQCCGSGSAWIRCIFRSG
jgi:hypothetical protein